jgi:hypothetical protein
MALYNQYRRDRCAKRKRAIGRDVGKTKNPEAQVNTERKKG